MQMPAAAIPPLVDFGLLAVAAALVIAAWTSNVDTARRTARSRWRRSPSASTPPRPQLDGFQRSSALGPGRPG
jgi:hypothetical protein